MTQPRDFPYIYVTWLSSILSGDTSCEWSVWFKTHYQNYPKVARDFNFARWNADHTALLNQKEMELRAEGKNTYLEAQNKFAIRGSTAVLGGKADLVGDSIVSGQPGWTVYDTKTGRPKDSDTIQVQIYMWALPRAVERYRGSTFDGCVVYRDHEVPIPASTITGAFVDRLTGLIRRLASEVPARKVPAFGECRFCEITTSDCPERIEGEEQASTTEEF